MPKQTRLDDNAEIYQQRKEQTEKEKLHDMSFRDKISYLRDYYKVHALLSIAGISLIIYIIYMIITPNIETQFYAAMIDNTINAEVLENFQEEFSEHLQLDPKLENLNFNTSFFSQNDYTMQQMLMTFMAAQEIDVIIAPESQFSQYAYHGYMDNVSDQLPTDLYSSLTNNFFYSDLEDDSTQHVYGIYLTESELYKNNSINNDPYVLGIIVNSKHKENSIEFLRYLFQLFP